MVKTFPKGGIHPSENKISAEKKIENLPLPESVSIPVSQHIGTPAIPVVKKGDKVKTGTLIAKSAGFVSANIHSSVSGIVTKIDNITDSSGFKNTAVIINVEGDEWEDNIIRDNRVLTQISADKEEIIKKIADNGIVGLGGATFPTNVKLSIPKGKKAELLIINGVECEPYLTSDHRLMIERAEELIVGTKILMKALSVDKAIIGIENNKPDAIKLLNQLSDKRLGIEVVELKVQYPQGGEKQLIKACTGREVPSGGLPVDVGVVVQNVGTAFAVYEAVQKNKPLFERVVSVTGKSVAKPSNFFVRIGTPVANLIEASGGIPENTGKIINGGPMMGKALSTTKVPVTKGTSGILIMNTKESKREKTQNCIRCAKCVFVCPMGLEPYLLMQLAEKMSWELTENNKTLDCIECGSCSYICPSKRPLLDYIRLSKTNVIRIKRESQK